MSLSINTNELLTTGPLSNQDVSSFIPCSFLKVVNAAATESEISPNTWIPNKGEVGFDGFLPGTVSNGLLSDPRDVENDCGKCQTGQNIN